MSPRNETPRRLAAFLSEIKSSHPSAERLADPQFYVSTVPQPNKMRLKDYQHLAYGLGPSSFQPHQISQYVKDTLTWQYGLEVSAIISPTVSVDDMHGQWVSVATELARETVAQHSDHRPLLVNLVVGEAALRQSHYLDRWVDSLAELDAPGFYLIVNRDLQDYQQHFEATALAALLRICYSLAHLKKRTVIVGYTDMLTVLLHAVGVQATGAGWFTNLRQFNMARFEPRRGGPSNPRYSSLPLLNSIFVEELDGIYNGAGVGNVLSGTPLDRRFGGSTVPSLVPWPRDEAALHHWHVLAEIANIPTGASVSARLDAAQLAIRRAAALYRQVAPHASFARSTNGAHLDSWSAGLRRFRTQAGV